ncbi:unnamed protein product [Rotaria magnacalcarata]|uniref:Uncharacterized protein n=3 Tax=Rotaria magnacalcarata TaxID=392030 RepID=A0A819ZKH0_9BILA|nr:unnamed protein product [Rotaria magnacalcarata]CAF2104740.1 unnamed protein product [Rotaria magnacalcarata]CAF4012853.1 unnamed protein product [Rotaria magnacalcarata]CAF4172223.1 unnamed protein product [Rotaria magnacalcarata]
MILTRESIDPCILCNVLAPIFICGFFSNIICIIVFLRQRFRTRSISVYFIALFFNDCILLFISHVAKMLIFDASKSCWFNIYLTKFIDIMHYYDLIDHGGLSVLTYNTTYTQISMLIFMFMSIQRVRTFSSISYRESRMCAFMLTLIAFIYGITVSYIQLYDGFCVKELELNQNQNLRVNLLINDAKYAIDEQCSMISMNNTVFNLTAAMFPFNTVSHPPYLIYPIRNESLNNNTDSMCHSGKDWHRIRHRTVAYVYLQSYMSIDWPDEYANRSECALEEILPKYLLSAIDNITRPLLQSRPGKDYFLEHQFCAQTSHFIDMYANCSFPITASTFKNFYQFLYDRRLSLKNRYTIGFIIGTFIPSSICIISSFMCLYYISNQPLIRKHSHSRAELRSLSLILVEILLSLMSALQSYVINFFTCHRLLFRMQSDNCYGESNHNILPMFLGSILELFTSTSNILILMICGAQFRNELIEILHLKKLFSKRKQNQANDERNGSRKKSSLAIPLRIVRTSRSAQSELNRKSNIIHDPSLDSLIVGPGQHADDISMIENEQQSDETTRYLIKLTTV